MAEKIRWAVRDTETGKYYSEFWGEVAWVNLEDAWLYRYSEEPDMYTLREKDDFVTVKVIETRELVKEGDLS